MNKTFPVFVLFFSFVTLSCLCHAQQITGTWKGKINSQRVELKIIQKGDSLTGTSYYYGLTGSHKRYSIKGYFDPNDNSAVWWDDELITANGATAAPNSLLSVADFNCPNGGRMFLNGRSSGKATPEDPTGKVSLTKVDHPTIHDEWDFVLDNYTAGGNDPYLIDSVSRIATVRKPVPARPVIIPPVQEEVVAKASPVIKPAPAQPQPKTIAPVKEPVVVKAPPVAIQKKVEPAKPATIEELFTTRKKVFTKEIPIEGDSIRLHFYDNAEVDGDSITLYLNNKMIFSHVRLAATPYNVTLAVNDLANKNELVMVAENLGSIPPNTAFMIAMIAGKRYEAYLESTEGSSSLIRFTKAK